MLTKSYVIREVFDNGTMIRPVATNRSEGSLGEYLFGNSYSDESFESREDAEQAIYEYFVRMQKNEWGSMYVSPRFAVIELFGFYGE